MTAVSPYSTFSRPATFAMPMPLVSPGAAAVTSIPTPSSSTSTISAASSNRLRKVMLPPSAFGASPCLIEFSTSGCKSIAGTTTSSDSGSSSLITRSLSRPNRTCSMSR